MGTGSQANRAVRQLLPQRPAPGTAARAAQRYRRRMPDIDLADLAELTASHNRLLAALSGGQGLDDQAARAPSGLPGWSRGHVLTHLARNADGLGNLVEWAVTGRSHPMYPSMQAREADIEAGAARPARELVADLTASSRRIEERLSGLAGPALDAFVEMGPMRVPTRAVELVSMRVREVEIHHVDLTIGYGQADWSREFVDRTLSQLVPRFASQGAVTVDRLVATDTGGGWVFSPASTGAGELAGPAHSLLGWLTGRIRRDAAAGAGLALSGGGAVPSPPPWT
jgi:maleylpyruvate isomerase